MLREDQESTDESTDHDRRSNNQAFFSRRRGSPCGLCHAYGQNIGFNFDVGHYFAGTKGLSPIPVIEKYHDRIVSLHLEDRTADGGNLPWGQGQTPIKEILQLMRSEKWTFPANIELEYTIPEGSSSVAEVAKCVQYCREALA